MNSFFFLIFKLTTMLKVTDFLFFANLKDISFATTGCSNSLLLGSSNLQSRCPNLHAPTSPHTFYKLLNFLHCAFCPQMIPSLLASPEASLINFLFS